MAAALRDGGEQCPCRGERRGVRAWAPPGLACQPFCQLVLTFSDSPVSCSVCKLGVVVRGVKLVSTCEALTTQSWQLSLSSDWDERVAMKAWGQVSDSGAAQAESWQESDVRARGSDHVLLCV